MNNIPSPRIINSCIDTHSQQELRLSVQFRLLMTVCCFKSYNLITLTNNRLKKPQIRNNSKIQICLKKFSTLIAKLLKNCGNQSCIFPHNQQTDSKTYMSQIKIINFLNFVSPVTGKKQSLPNKFRLKQLYFNFEFPCTRTDGRMDGIASIML